MPNQMLNLSSADLQKAAVLQARIEDLQAKLAELLGAGAGSERTATKRTRGPMPEAQRAKLSKAAKARWKKSRAAGKSTL